MKKHEIGVYYFPNYHLDQRNEKWHGRGWTEWELVKRAEPKYPGHYQPRVPSDGFEDESDPSVMEKKIRMAHDSGITSFIYDWYWYNDGPYLNGALERGFLEAQNTNDLKFALMWANHDWVDIHPATKCGEHSVLKQGVVTPEAFESMCRYIIENYFTRENYWRVDGGLYFSIYMPTNLAAGFGGIKNARKMLDKFRKMTAEAGLGKLHLNVIIWGKQILPGEKPIEDINLFTEQMGFDSITTYVWAHQYMPSDRLVIDYNEMAEVCTGLYGELSGKYKLPYYPNVTVGWDSSPRTIQSDIFEVSDYPFFPIVENNTPENFKKALEKARDYMDGADKKILTVNAWNEWTEGSYLEPDKKYGMGYLDAIREVFGSNE